MGLVRRIGRAFRRVTRVFRRVTDFVKNPIAAISKPLSKILGPFKGIVDKVLNKLPGQLKGLVGGFLNKFMSSPLGGVLSSVLGPFGAMLGAATSTNQLLGFAQQAAGTPAFAHPQGGQNMQAMFAANYARMFFHC